MIQKRQSFFRRWGYKLVVGSLVVMLPAVVIAIGLLFASISTVRRAQTALFVPNSTLATSQGIHCAATDAACNAAALLKPTDAKATPPKPGENKSTDPAKAPSTASGVSTVPAGVAPLGGTNLRHLDLANWQSWTSPQTGGGGWGNGELQTYTANSENVRYENGKLIIQGRGSSGSGYTSARLDSHGKLDISPNTRIDVTAKLPSGRGTWPAIWLWRPGNIAGATDPEIDIMEFVGAEPGQINSSAHSANHYPGHAGRSGYKQVASASSTSHVYSIVWKSGYLETWVDNQRILRVDSSPDVREWPYTEPMHFILNLAIGGSWGGEAGIDDASVTGWTFEISDITLQQL